MPAFFFYLSYGVFVPQHSVPFLVAFTHAVRSWAKDLLVLSQGLRTNTENFLSASDLKFVQLLDMSHLTDAGFAAIEQR